MVRRGGRNRTTPDTGETIGNRPPGPDDTLVLASGALAHEVLAVLNANGLESLRPNCPPAKLTNYPTTIPDDARQATPATLPNGARHVRAYAD